jgi:hypothetical protein
MMAQQYLRGALSFETDPEKKIAVHKAILQTAILLNDPAASTNICEIGRAAAVSDDDKAELALAEIDALIKLGDRAATYRLWAEAAPYAELPAWQDRFAAKEAAIQEQTLADDGWFAEWLKESGALSDAKVVRRQLHDSALATCERLSALDSPTGDECLLRAARLRYRAKDYNDALMHLRALLERGRSTFDNEVMLMLMRISEVLEDQKTADGMLQRALDRVSWENRAAGELLRLLDEAESENRHVQALMIAERCLQAPMSETELNNLRVRTAGIATELKLYSKAISYYDQVLNTVLPTEIHAAATLGKATANLKKQDFNRAKEGLLRYLTAFSEPPQRANALFMLVEAYRRSNQATP